MYKYEHEHDLVISSSWDMLFSECNFDLGIKILIILHF